MDAIDKARSAIEDRLRELQDEEKRLKAALKHLVDRNAPSQGRPRGSTNRRTTTRKRAPRGQRERQLLASIKGHPNYKQADHAKEIGIKPNQVYGLINKLNKDGKVKKSKDGTLTLAN
jgi:hypothetical protein